MYQKIESWRVMTGHPSPASRRLLAFCRPARTFVILVLLLEVILSTLAARFSSFILVFFVALSTLAAEPGELSGSPTVMIGFGIGATSVDSNPSMIYEPALSIIFFSDEHKTIPSMGVGIKASIQIIKDGHRGLGVALEGFKNYFGGEIGVIFPRKDLPVGVGPPLQIGYQATGFVTWHRLVSLYVRQTYTPNWHQPNETDVGLLFMLPGQFIAAIFGLSSYVLNTRR